jgi:hypothetical protein
VGNRARGTALLSRPHQTCQRALSAGDKLESRAPLEDRFSTLAPQYRDDCDSLRLGTILTGLEISAGRRHHNR